MPAAGIHFQVDGTDATVIDIPQVVASPLMEQLVRALWLVSSLTLVLVLSAALYHPAVGPVFGAHKVAYYGTLGAILAVAAIEMVTA